MSFDPMRYPPGRAISPLTAFRRDPVADENGVSRRVRELECVHAVVRQRAETDRRGFGRRNVLQGLGMRAEELFDWRGFGRVGAARRAS